METKQRERNLVIITMVCVGLFAFDKLIFTPLTNLWGERSLKIAALEKSLTKGQFLIDRENSIKNNWKSIVKNGLPDDESAAENLVLKAIYRWSQVSLLNVASFKPQWVKNEEDCVKLECRVAAAGDLGSITRFLYELETDPLPLLVEEIEISSQDDKGEKLMFSVKFSGVRAIEIKAKPEKTGKKSS